MSSPSKVCMHPSKMIVGLATMSMSIVLMSMSPEKPSPQEKSRGCSIQDVRQDISGSMESRGTDKEVGAGKTSN